MNIAIHRKASHTHTVAATCARVRYWFRRRLFSLNAELKRCSLSGRHRLFVAEFSVVWTHFQQAFVHRQLKLLSSQVHHIRILATPVSLYAHLIQLSILSTCLKSLIFNYLWSLIKSVKSQLLSPQLDEWRRHRRRRRRRIVVYPHRMPLYIVQSLY